MTSRQTYAAFRAALAKQSEALAKEFDAAVQDIRSSAQMIELDHAIAHYMSTGDASRVWLALHLDQNFWARMEHQRQLAYVEGALHQISDIPKRLPGGAPGFVVRFDQTNPRAENAVRQMGADLITGIKEDTRVLVRNVLSAGAESSTPPRELAQQLIGKKVGTKRNGGLIGLSSPQTTYVQSARAELADPEKMGNYFTRQRRDKRFDGTVRRAMDAGQPLDKVTIDRIASRYADRLLQLRGETIGVTESLRALNAGKHEAIQQMVDSGEVPQEAVQRQWVSDPRLHHRDGHWLMNKDTVAMHAKFTNPLTGEQLAYPGDPEAPPSETIWCKCQLRSVVDYVAVAKARGTL